MKSCYRLMAAAASLASAGLLHGQVVLLVDFSSNVAATSTVDGVSWNTLSDRSISGSIADLVATDGSSSGISISVTDAFDGDRNWGTTGTSADDLGLLAVDSATADGFSFRTLLLDPAELTFAGLDTETMYTLTIFGEGHENASLSGPTDFTATGSNIVSGMLNTNLNDTEVLVLDGIMANESGILELFMIASGDNTYSMINALSLQAMAPVPEPSTYALIAGMLLVPFTIIRRRLRKR